MLQYAEISAVYPKWEELNQTRVDDQRVRQKLIQKIKPFILETIAEELPPPYIVELDHLKELKPNQKLRILKNKLIIDNRILCSSIRRKISGDSRNKVLKMIGEYIDTDLNYEQKEILSKILNVLTESTYKSDPKWREQANLMKKTMKCPCRLMNGPITGTGIDTAFIQIQIQI